jgi:hypothetical protein
MTKDFFRDKISPHFIRIEAAAIKAANTRWQKEFNPFKLTNYCMKARIHPGAIAEGLESTVKCSEHIREPWAYCIKVIKARSQMKYEKIHVKRHEKVMVAYKDFVDNSEAIQDLCGGMF